MTNRGVFLNIDESVYFIDMCGMKFYFSSVFYQKKFKERYESERKIFAYKMQSQFDCNIYADRLSDLLLYKKIEKRGFRVVYKEVTYKCLSNLKFELQLKIKP